jgi:Cu2+-exporting ATPase
LPVPTSASRSAPEPDVAILSAGVVLASCATIVVAINAQLLRRLDLRPA